MKVIEKLRRICISAIKRIDQDIDNPLNVKVREYLEGKKQAYRTIHYYITEFQETNIKSDLDEYFLQIEKDIEDKEDDNLLKPKEKEDEENNTY